MRSPSLYAVYLRRKGVAGADRQLRQSCDEYAIDARHMLAIITHVPCGSGQTVRLVCGLPVRRASEHVGRHALTLVVSRTVCDHVERIGRTMVV